MSGGEVWAANAADGEASERNVRTAAANAAAAERVRVRFIAVLISRWPYDRAERKV